jgi:hypothetical protein
MKAILDTRMAIFALTCVFVPITAQAADPIVGTWRLVSWTTVETESKAVHNLFGEHPSGMETFTPDGWFFFIITDPSRKPPAAPKTTDAEAAQLYRTMGATAGRWRTDDNRWFISQEIVSSPAFVGTEAKGEFEIKGDRLEGKSDPFTSSLLGTQVFNQFVWERVK